MVGSTPLVFVPLKIRIQHQLPVSVDQHGMDFAKPPILDVPDAQFDQAGIQVYGCERANGNAVLQLFRLAVGVLTDRLIFAAKK